jgi:putative glycosyl hydrolase-like family 6 (GHL6) protein
VTRRDFFQTTLAAASAAAAAEPVPWYRRCLRWGQTNITEHDPVNYDIPWWREYWKRTAVQGVIVNAGGIVAYYPSKFPLHHRAEFLNGRDLYGELAQAAHDDGLAVLARMDSNRTAEDFFQAHPDWFARRQSGEPYRADDKYVTCVNGPYYDEYIPGILREIVERSHPEGFADNSWSGLQRNSICYCDNCARKFRNQTGSPLPARKNWDDAAYRKWIEWSYARRVEIWDQNNRVTKAAGGPHCLWLGMNSGSITSQSNSLRDFREIARRSEFLLLDHQSRSDATGFQQNADAGKLVHGLLGWDKVIIESMALYQVRVASKPEPEARMWMLEGIAGGIGPWWHMVGAFHDDRRMYRTPEKVFQWHRQNEQYLVNRAPVAAVGIVWSQQNTDFFGRDEAAELVDAPYRGFAQALLRARIPYLPVHVDDIESQAALAALVLPNLGALSDAQCQSVRRFAGRGGVVASGSTSLYTENGDARRDFALADLFGAHAATPDSGRKAAQQAHTYLRLQPEAARHEVLQGFDETDIIPYGGTLERLRTDPGVTVPLTYVPPFPVFPPETAWMREPKTDIPGLVLNASNSRRVAYLAADLDRRYAHGNLPDHATLLANLVRWAAGDRIGLEVHGAGLLDCQVYRQAGRLIVHVVNLSNEGAWRGPLDELIAVGPLEVRVRMPEDVRGRKIECLVSGLKPALGLRQGWASFQLKSVLDHEVVVIS